MKPLYRNALITLSLVITFCFSCKTQVTKTKSLFYEGTPKIVKVVVTPYNNDIVEGGVDFLADGCISYSVKDKKGKTIYRIICQDYLICGYNDVKSMKKDLKNK